MATCRSWNWHAGLVGLLAISGALSFSRDYTLAQIAPDTTLGADSSVVTPNASVGNLSAERIDGGAVRGANLFHSFQEFNIREGQRVYFTNPAGIENILSRVTGSNASAILGTLGVDGAANLFLLNPNGIIFGPKAQLDIAGSFFASTGNRLVFDNGLEFSASNPQAPPLLTINLRPGLQYGSNHSGTISNSGNLAVGQNLTLAAGNLDLQGQLHAGSNLTLFANNTVRLRDTAANPFIASAGGGLLVQGNQGVDIFALNHPESGLFSVENMVLRSANPVGGDAHYTVGGSFLIEQLDRSLGNLVSLFDPIIRASGDVSFSSYTGASLHILAGGSVNIGSITITGSDPTGNTINPTTSPALANVTLSDGRPLVINGTSQPTLDIRAGTSAFGIPGITGNNYTTLSPIPNMSASASSADITIGNITVTAPDGLVFLTNQYAPNRSLGGTIQVGTINTSSSTGNSGNVMIDSRSNIILPSSGYINSAATSAIGKAGDVTLMTRNAISADNFIIDSSTFGNGEGGNITLKTGSLSFTNGAQLIADTFEQGNAGRVNVIATDSVSFDGVGSNGASSGAFSQVNSGAVGNGGNLNIITRSLSVTKGAQLNASTSGNGNAGRVNLAATDSISFDGVGTNGQSSRAASRVEAGAVGNGGNLRIITRSLSVTNGAVLSASTTGNGDAGRVNITATDTVSFDGVGSNEQSSGAFSQVNPGAVGNGGDINLSTRSLSVSNGAVLVANTRGQGEAGSVNITATDTISFDGVGSNGLSSGAFSNVTAGAVGNGGNLNITSRSLSMSNRTQLIASTRGQGDAGKISLQASDSLSLTNSGIFSTVFAGAVGQGGNIDISTGLLSLNTAAISSTNNAGTGRAGNIEVKAHSVDLDRGGIIARTVSGQGGNIALEVQDLLLLRNRSLISTTAGTDQAGGDGGNIMLTSKFIVAVPTEDSNITANAYQGRGGNIKIAAQGIFGIEFREYPTPLSDITASSELGINGVVEITNPGVDPSRGLTTLPTDFVDPTGLIDHRCQMGSGSTTSEFTITGRGGLPPNPNEPLDEEGLLEDFGSTTALRDGQRGDKLAAAPASDGSQPNRIVEAQGWIIDDGKVILTAQAPTVTPQHPWQTPTACQGVSKTQRKPIPPSL
jgi:filamentous hemagglutinin family protein